MKKILVIFFILLLVLFVSNPSKSEYDEWANKKITGTNNNFLSAVGTAIASPIISATTTSENYSIFTIYKTVNIDGSIYKTLGIFRNFIFISKTEGNTNLINNSIGVIKNSINNSSVNVNSLIEDASVKANEFIESANKTINEKLTSQPIQTNIEDSEEINVGGTITEGSDYNNYVNGRYGFSIDYPTGFNIGVAPQNGDGLEFVSKDGKAVLIAYGSNNVMDDNAKDMYEAQIASIKEISYKYFKDNWFVLSWVENGTVYYTKFIVGEGSINSFLFSCPEEQLKQYYEIIEHISKSFEKGSIENSN